MLSRAADGYGFHLANMDCEKIRVSDDGPIVFYVAEFCTDVSLLEIVDWL